MEDIDLRDKTTGELMKDLSRQLSDLIHEEMELARAEMTPKAKAAAVGAGMFGAAGVVALLGAGALVAAAIAAIAVVLPVWLAALIIGVLLVAGGGAAAMIGRVTLRAASPPAPEMAIETTKEDVEWLKARTRSAKR